MTHSHDLREFDYDARVRQKWIMPVELPFSSSYRWTTPFDEFWLPEKGMAKGLTAFDQNMILSFSSR